MNKLWEWLNGKKTYIGAAVVFIAGGSKALGWIDDETFTWVAAIGGAISVFGLRAALKKI